MLCVFIYVVKHIANICNLFSNAIVLHPVNNIRDMKKKDCKCEFASERSEALLKNFRASLARQSYISKIKAFKDAVEAPAPRFWVSEARAMRVITQLFKGIDLTEGMHTEKRKMYLEIFRRVKEARAASPATSLGDIVFDVVNSEAPSSYISWQMGRLILKERKNHEVK